MTTCPNCGHRFGPKKKVSAWQQGEDQKRYDAAMVAKREHEMKYGPIRPQQKDDPKLHVVK